MGLALRGEYAYIQFNMGANSYHAHKHLRRLHPLARRHLRKIVIPSNPVRSDHKKILQTVPKPPSPIKPINTKPRRLSHTSHDNSALAILHITLSNHYGI